MESKNPRLFDSGGRAFEAQVRSTVFDSQNLSDNFSCYSHSYTTSNSPYLRGGQTRPDGCWRLTQVGEKVVIKYKKSEEWYVAK